MMLSVALVGITAASYHRWLTRADAELGVQPSPMNDNVIVVVKGEEINLGEETDYTFEEQIELLWILFEFPDHGMSMWYLESWLNKNTEGEESNQRHQMPTLPARPQPRSSLPSLKLPPLPSRTDAVRGKPRGKLPPLPSEIGKVPRSLPDEQMLPMSKFSKPPPLGPFPTDIRPPTQDNDVSRRDPLHPTGRPIHMAHSDPLGVNFLPTGTPAPAQTEEPAKDDPQATAPADSNKLPREKPAEKQPLSAMGDTRPPIGKIPRPPKLPGAPPLEPPGFKLPGFIQLPAKLIAILKRVVSRLSTNAALPNEIRDVLKLVLHLLERISKGPALPIPTSTSKILPTLTRPPIGKKPTLPPLPLPTSTSTPALPPPVRPPPPGKGKLPIRPPPGKLPPRPPPGKGKLPSPRPPGKGKGQVDDELVFGDESLSGFIEVTRRAAQEDGGDMTVWPTSAPTAATTNNADDNQGPVELLGKRPLTKKQRQYMMGQAAVLMHEEIEREKEKNPNDPVNDLLNVPTCMAVFSRVAKHAEKWMGKQNPAERKEIEDSIVEVEFEENWDNGEGVWF